MAAHESQQRIRIDGGPEVEVTLNELRPGAWTTSGVPESCVDVNRDGHIVTIIGGDRAGWEAAAGHGINKNARPHEVILNGREPFGASEGDPNQMAARIVRKATEGK